MNRESGTQILNIAANFFLTVGILCLLYYMIILIYAGRHTAFGWFWIVSFAACTALSILFRYILKHNIEVPKAVWIALLIIAFIGVSIFAMIEGTIIRYANMKPDRNADYVIVLGAQVRGTNITKSLKKRLDTAADYLDQNPNATAIVSGGKGPGELISEAEAMRQYLLKKGIPHSQVIMEDQSTNTRENIFYSKKLMKGNDNTIVIVSNGFHIYRAVCIAKKQNIGQVEALAAPTDNILRVSYYVREVLAVMKDKMLGNI
jgi:Uncharacterized conserved protein